MKKFFCLIIPIFFISCEENVSIPSTGQPDISSTDNKMSYPQIYLSQTDQFISVNDINRGDKALSLSDQVILSAQKQEGRSFDLNPLAHFKDSQNLKIKVSSFCSYDSGESEESSSVETEKIEETRRVSRIKAVNKVERIDQEMASKFYHRSFSIFDLFPKEALFSSLNRSYHCTFIFAVKNEKGSFNYYSIIQQIIQPSFPSNNVQDNQLSLVRETESGYYLPIGPDLITHQKLSKIFLVNNTRQLADNYQIYCEGLKLFNAPGASSNVHRILLNLIAHGPEDFPEGVKKCRVFSRNKERVTGMTNFFNIDFSSLKKPKPAINLETVNEPVVSSFTVGKSYQKGASIPIDSYFHFENVQAELDYSPLEITVDTTCSNEEIFGKGNLLSKTYRFPFRRKFPVMAVTPEQVFAMRMPAQTYKKMLKYRDDFQNGKDSSKAEANLSEDRLKPVSRCTYKMNLRHRNELQLFYEKVFRERIYLIRWGDNSYGIDQDPRDNLFHIIKHLNNMIGYNRTVEYFEGSYPAMSTIESINTGARRKPFLEVKPDIYDNSIIGYLYFNFFDTANDSFFQAEGHNLDNMVLKCYGKKQQGTDNSIEVSQPYSARHRSFVSLKTLFSSSEMRSYAEREELLICRLMLYEGDILRYFSNELKFSK